MRCPCKTFYLNKWFVYIYIYIYLFKYVTKWPNCPCINLGTLHFHVADKKKPNKCIAPTLCPVTIKGVCNTFMYTLRHYCLFHRLRFESKTNQAKIKIRIQFLAWCIVMHDEVHACMRIIAQLLCWKNGNIYTHTFLGRATIHCLFRENFVQGRNPVERWFR